jgi:hypothetical protein
MYLWTPKTKKNPTLNIYELDFRFLKFYILQVWTSNLSKTDPFYTCVKSQF